MIITKQWFTVGIVLSAIGLFAPPTIADQHGPAPHAAGSGQQQHAPGQHPGGATTASYDVKTEVTLTGTVVHVNVAHGSGSRGMAAQDGTLALKTETGTVDVQLAPTTFLAEKKVKIAKGDTVDVIGSRVSIGDSQVVLARGIRKGNTSWTLRDAGGAPLWASTAHGQHR